MATTNNVLPICNSQFLFNAEIGEHDDGLSIFLSVRCNLFRIAYRMLKNAAEAEDIVQDVWLRWQTTDRRVVLDPPAYLATATTRMCINLYRSARCRRERYVDSWLTEPVDTVSNPWQGTECKEALMSAVCELLEKLRPTERAAYVLRKAFDCSYRQIANILQMEETNVRQLVSPCSEESCGWTSGACKLSQAKAAFGCIYRCSSDWRSSHTRESFDSGCFLWPRKQ